MSGQGPELCESWQRPLAVTVKMHKNRLGSVVLEGTIKLIGGWLRECHAR